MGSRQGREDPLPRRQAVRVPADLGKRKKTLQHHLLGIPAAAARPVWGLGLPVAQAARATFRTPDSCPLEYFGKRLNWEVPGLRGISRHGEPVCTPSGGCRSCLWPGSLPGQPTPIIPFPASAASQVGSSRELDEVRRGFTDRDAREIGLPPPRPCSRFLPQPHPQC